MTGWYPRMKPHSVTTQKMVVLITHYVLQKRFSEVQLKFQRFRSPSNLEPRLARALRELRGVEEATCLLELASDDPEGIEGQLKHCMVLYGNQSD
jgi:hypothetical protein